MHAASQGYFTHMECSQCISTMLVSGCDTTSRLSPPENAVLIAKMLMVYQIVYYNAMVLAKFSYLAFYLRIFVSREFRILTWVCMGCAGAYWTGSMLQIFLICTPFERNWNPTLPGHCASQNVAFSTIGAFNLLTDVMIMALPIRFVWKLQMSLATKLAVVGIFGLGILYVFFALLFPPGSPSQNFNQYRTVFPPSPSSESVFSPPSISPICPTP